MSLRVVSVCLCVCVNACVCVNYCKFVARSWLIGSSSTKTWSNFNAVAKHRAYGNLHFYQLLLTTPDAPFDALRFRTNYQAPSTTIIWVFCVVNLMAENFQTRAQWKFHRRRDLSNKEIESGLSSALVGAFMSHFHVFLTLVMFYSRIRCDFSLIQIDTSSLWMNEWMETRHVMLVCDKEERNNKRPCAGLIRAEFMLHNERQMTINSMKSSR